MALRRRPRLPDDITPEERERRIAELRERRRRRMRVLAVRSAIGTAALLVLGAALLYWLLATFGGRDFLLARIAGLLPAGTELTWSGAEGPASGPLVIHDLRYVQRSCPDVDGKPVAFDGCADPPCSPSPRARWCWTEITPLVGRRLRLDAGRQAGHARPAGDRIGFELPTWPEYCRASTCRWRWSQRDRVDGLRVTAPVRRWSTSRASAASSTRAATTCACTGGGHDRGLFSADGRYAPRDNYRTDLVATAVLPAPFARPRRAVG